jgi:hypothetical protein
MSDWSITQCQVNLNEEAQKMYFIEVARQKQWP